MEYSIANKSEYIPPPTGQHLRAPLPICSSDGKEMNHSSTPEEMKASASEYVNLPLTVLVGVARGLMMLTRFGHSEPGADKK